MKYPILKSVNRFEQCMSSHQVTRAHDVYVCKIYNSSIKQLSAETARETQYLCTPVFNEEIGSSDVQWNRLISSIERDRLMIIRYIR